MYYKRSTGAILVRKSAETPSWVKWVHHSQGPNCCQECLMLDGCWFLESNTPTWPHHPHCHCTLDPIDYATVSMNVAAYSDYGKFDPYLFNTHGQYTHTKEKLFAQWGYTVEDAHWLQAEMERQAREKYTAGEYTLGRLNKDGQRVSIRIEIPRKDGIGTVSFISGWMVQPNGQLRLITPYGGNSMKMMDCIEVTAEKSEYARDGVHMGMQGWICMDQYRDGYWLVNFPQMGENPDIATLGIKEEDMKLVPVMDASINERIKTQFENSGSSSKSLPEKPDDLSGYLI